MLVANAAPKYTRFGINQTSALINNGESIRVYGIIASTTAGGTVTIADKLGTTILVINLSASVPFELKTGFIASNGVAVTTDSNCTCTVFHGQSGA